MKRIVFGILAHVDSGKTTLSEGMLYLSGKLRKLGRVDHGDAFLDTHSIERDRGITIFSKQAVFSIDNTEFTLLDTPGHVDFSMETERTLNVLDYAVLVISGSDGIQSHTETLWKLLKRYNIPTFIFINKMDLPAAERGELMASIHKYLSDSCIDFSDETSDKSQFNESIAMCDEEILNCFLESGKVESNLINRAIAKRHIFPCYFGSALKLDGIKELLEGLSLYTVAPQYKKDFAARVFKISEDDQGNRLTHMKITGGSLKVKDVISGIDREQKSWAEKADQIRIYSGEKFKTAESADAGTVCAIKGLSYTYPGEGLGDEQNSEKTALSPVLSYTVQLPPGMDIHTAITNLRILEQEEPQFNIIWNEQLREIHIRLMGEIQIEVLKQIILDRFNMNVDFVRGSIAYKETISNIVEGVGHYEPLRHYAEVHLLLEPGKPGSGLKFEIKCSEDKLDKNWQRLIMTHLHEKTHIGVLTGSPITDMKITLVSGRAHKKHTDGGDFRQATYRAVRQGLRNAQSVLLEPWYNLRIEVPNECTGRAMTDIQKAGGRISPPETDGETTVITGSAPVAEMIDYYTELSAYTSGKGRMSCMLCGYEPCSDPERVIAEIGYDCDGDLDNTADSIFCAHGAGYSVRWDEVYDHMHLESELKLRTEREDIAKNARAKSYIESVVSDKELMRIFEKTYGPIKREPYTEHIKRTGMPPSTPKRRKPSVTPKTEYLLVDGYNIIYAWDDLKQYAEDNLNLARTMLADTLCSYSGFKQCEVILVFDAYKVKNNPGTVEKYHNISIVYTKERETADTYIEKTSQRLGRNNIVRVATSDGAEQLIILGNGALRITASELKSEVNEVKNAISEYINSLNNK